MFRKLASVCICVLGFAASNCDASRVKDISTIEGVRDNQLVGYGLVVGLDGTGDRTNQTPFTEQSFQSMLLQFGLKLPAGKSSQLKNVAAVALSATLPPFTRSGQKIDVTISSIGNSTSLRGGTLLMAPLRGIDGKTYAISQGSVVVSGFGVKGSDGSKVSVNSTSSGSIPNGATIEKTIPAPFVKDGTITLQLTEPDFTTAERMQDAINSELGYPAASAIDASAVQVKVINRGPLRDNFLYVPIISQIQNVLVEPAGLSAKVIVNSRSGTIVIGNNVTVAPVAVSHGNLSVVIKEKAIISQPNGLSNGSTVKAASAVITIDQEAKRAFTFAPGPSLNELVAAINQVGAAPGDLIAILEAIKAAGALNADLEVI
jgi:flagellar P-ring protein precursor FlgI